MGIYGRSRGSLGVWWFLLLADLDGLLWVVVKISGIFLINFFWGNDANSSGMPFGHCLRHLFGWILVLGGLR